MALFSNSTWPTVLDLQRTSSLADMLSHWIGHPRISNSCNWWIIYGCTNGTSWDNRWDNHGRGQSPGLSSIHWMLAQIPIKQCIECPKTNDSTNRHMSPNMEGPWSFFGASRVISASCWDVYRCFLFQMSMELTRCPVDRLHGLS